MDTNAPPGGEGLPAPQREDRDGVGELEKHMFVFWGTEVESGLRQLLGEEA